MELMLCFIFALLRCRGEAKERCDLPIYSGLHPFKTNLRENKWGSFCTYGFGNSPTKQKGLFGCKCGGIFVTLVMIGSLSLPKFLCSGGVVSSHRLFKFYLKTSSLHNSMNYDNDDSLALSLALIYQTCSDWNTGVCRDQRSFWHLSFCISSLWLQHMARSDLTPGLQVVYTGLSHHIHAMQR